MKGASLMPWALVCGALAGQSVQGNQALTLQEAIRISLKNNLQVQIAQETRTSTQAGELVAAGAFDWTLLGNAALSHTTVSYDHKVLSSGSQPVTGDSTTNARSLTLGVQKPFDWGGSLAVSYAPSYSSTSTQFLGTSPTTTSNPYSGSLSATYTQSLLKGLGQDVTGVNVRVAQKSSLSADYQYQKAIIDQVASTESLYWDVVFAQRNLDNKRQALALAQKQLRENKIRVQVGTLAPIEVTSAEAAVAQKEQDIISAEAQLLNAKDALIRALYPLSQERPSSVETSDAPTLGHIVLAEDAAIHRALERRVELKAAKLDVESKALLEKASENRLKPQLDMSVGYVGNASNYDGYPPINTDLFSAKNPGYSVSLTFSMPIANRSARGALAQARASRHSSELTLKDLELSIVLEVKQAIRNVEAAEKGVEATKKTRHYREQDLDAEQKKFDNGMSTNFLVLSKQNDLDTAKSAEVQAQITYAKAVTSLEKALGNLMDARKLSFTS